MANTKKFTLPLNKIATYNKDGRKSLAELYKEYNELTRAGWKRRRICNMQGLDLNNAIISLPIYAYVSPPTKTHKPNGSFWILSGIHGEEPAGPNALSESIEKLIELNQKGMSFVLLPLLNPLGYCRDDRYFDAHRSEKPCHSVTDSEHLLLDINDLNKPRLTAPSNLYADTVLNWVLRTLKNYPPFIVVDHHEDEVEKNGIQHVDSGFTYSYACGNEEKLAPLCKMITAILKERNFPIQETGITRFNERIVNGFVLNNKDGSIDEFLTAKEYFRDQKRIKHAASAAFVVETTRDDEKNITLNQRVGVHKAIINLYQQMWAVIQASS